MKFEVTGMDKAETRDSLSDFAPGNLVVCQNEGDFGDILIVGEDDECKSNGTVIGNVQGFTASSLGYCSKTWPGPFTLFTGKITLSND